MKKIQIILFFIIFHAFVSWAQTPGKYAKVCVAFYNLENLFDTIDGPNNDTDFLPNGVNQWTSERYLHKLHQMATVISQIGMHGPDIIGVCEIENRNVLEDLIDQPELKHLGYDIAHFDSPDRRGVDCGLLYRKSLFKLTNSSPHFVAIPGEPEVLTRDILLVSGSIDGEAIHFLVGHWPSRAGGEKISLNRRMAAARVMKSVTDSIIKEDPAAKVILMGDFNDDPISPSVSKGLDLKDSPDNLKPHELYTPMKSMFKNGIGTLAYRDTWNLFDILVFNGNLAGNDFSSFKVLQDKKSGYHAHVFNKKFLLQKYGQYKGYPWRTFAGGRYEGGYSDHLPVYLYLVKELK